MIIYLLKSAICLAILLAVYHLLLEKERMHRFNRFFLLASLLIGLTIPLLSLTINVPLVSSITTYSSPDITDLSVNDPIFRIRHAKSVVSEVSESPSFSYGELLIVLYFIVAATLFSRFGFNLLTLIRRVHQYPKYPLGNATLVLVNQDLIPHSFGRYIFVSKKAYQQKNIQTQVLTHELTHVRENHTADILLIEFLRCVFWFNPLFICYKRAIQLNHEFLADQSVLRSNPDIASYQYLLLSVSGCSSVSLASHLNYSLTKKRLIMMKKHTSNLKIMTRTGFLVPVIILLAVFFSDRGAAQISEKAAAAQTAPEKSSGDPRYYLHVTTHSGVSMQKKFADMSPTERAYFQPTTSQMNDWKDASRFFVMIDSKLIPNNNLDKYNPTDFLIYTTHQRSVELRTNINLFTENYLEVNKHKGEDTRSNKLYINSLKHSEKARTLTDLVKTEHQPMTRNK